jgi:hypothetical protein
MTNFEYIKQMSIDDIVKYWEDKMDCDNCPMRNKCFHSDCKNCTDFIKAWLNSEYKEKE